MMSSSLLVASFLIDLGRGGKRGTVAWWQSEHFSGQMNHLWKYESDPFLNEAICKGYEYIKKKTLSWILLQVSF